MPSKIFVNLPVKNLQRSMDFFISIGFSFNQQFANHEAACMIISENIYAMLLTEERFKDFTKKEISDAHKSTEVLLALDFDSREAVDEIVQEAVAAGGAIYMDPMDHGWMYGHSFADLDGHQWEVMYMDKTALAQQQPDSVMQNQ